MVEVNVSRITATGILAAARITRPVTRICSANRWMCSSRLRGVLAGSILLIPECVSASLMLMMVPSVWVRRFIGRLRVGSARRRIARVDAPKAIGWNGVHDAAGPFCLQATTQHLPSRQRRKSP